MSQRMVSLSAITESSFTMDEVYLELSGVMRDFVRRTDITNVSVSVTRIDEDPFEDPKVVDDSGKVLSFRVWEILTRLGLSDADANTAISEIHEAGIIFAKKEQ